MAPNSPPNSSSSPRSPKVLLFSGSSNRPLSEKVAKSLGICLGDMDLRCFSDGEIFVKIKENVRGAHVYILQSTCTPVNDHLMEVLVIADTLRRASVGSITAILPYYGYARQDRKVAPRTPITAKLVADLLVAAGIGRMVSLDLHSGQIQGFFNIPFDNLFTRPVMMDYIRDHVAGEGDLVIVSPDAGGVERARAYAKKVNAKVAMIDKRRTGPNEAKAMHLVGDVRGCTAFIVDDMVDTAGTLLEGVSSLLKHGAINVYACAAHAVLSGSAVEKINASPLKEIIFTDTIPLCEEASKSEKFRVVTVAGLIAKAIERIHANESVSSLFD